MMEEFKLEKRTDEQRILYLQNKVFELIADKSDYKQKVREAWNKFLAHDIGVDDFEKELGL